MRDLFASKKMTLIASGDACAPVISVFGQFQLQFMKDKNSKSEKGLKDLRLVGVGREYIEKRFAEMQQKNETSMQTNVRKIKK